MKFRKYTEEQLREAVASSSSVAQALRKLGLAPYGGNYRTFWKSVDYFGLDTSHFLGKGWKRGRRGARKRPIGDYLTNKFPISSYKLKNRLLAEGFLEPVCVRCGIERWMGKPAPLELDHIDGDNRNNNFDNLRVLCPNCHAQTHTYRRPKK